MKEIHRLVITAKEIRGNCPVFSVGDKIVIKEPEILPEKTDALCVHALGSMLSMIIALSRGASFRELGLSRKKGMLAMFSVSILDLHTLQVEQSFLR